jgi:ankyrin repeat protein
VLLLQFLTPIWDDRTAEELAKYIDWHKRHPHCVTPRLNPHADTDAKSKLRIDPENPGKVYADNNVKINPLPPDFFPSELGVDGDIEEVSSVAVRTEYDELGYYLDNNHDDPWYIMSVKDHLEQSHYDGSHTTVKWKHKTTSNNFDKEQAWRNFKYSDYEGGNPRIGDDEAKALYELALKDKSNLFDSKPKKKVSPWAQEYKFSKFTAGGTALVAFKQKELTDNVGVALQLYEEDVLKGQKDGLGSAPSSKSKKNRKNNKQQEKNIQKTPLEEMKEKLGGTKQLEKVGVEWVKLAKNVAKKSKLQKSAVDGTIDLAEACEKFRVIKAASLLYTAQGDANMLTADDEPLFLHTFQRAIRMDTMSNSLRPGDEKTDVPDRVKLQKLLELLVKFEANVNTMEGKDGLGVVHYASMTDNTKMLNWLIKNKADLNVFTLNDEAMTPLMLAAKYGNVYALAELIKNNVNPNVRNSAGMTALHYAAKYGQTRASLFLMRIGGSKKIQNNNGKTPAALAQDGYV